MCGWHEGFSESVVEDAALAWLESLGYAVLHGPEIAAGEPGAERSDPNYRDVVLERRLRQALVRLNPDLPPEALEDAYRKLTRVDAPSLVERNRAVHRMLVDGVTVEYRRDGRLDRRRAGAGDRLRRAGQQRLARRQPVHRVRGAAHAPAGRGAVRQRPAAGGDRAQERGRRERDGLVGLPAAPDLPGADPGAVRDQRRAGRLRRRAGAHRLARRGQGVVQALAHDHRARGRAGSSCPSCRWCWRACSSKRRFLDLVRHFIVFEDPRGRRQARQEDGRLPPVPRGERGGGGDAARGATLAADRSQSRRAATRPGSGRAASRATGASAWSGTRRARARA